MENMTKIVVEAKSKLLATEKTLAETKAAFERLEKFLELQTAIVFLPKSKFNEVNGLLNHSTSEDLKTRPDAETIFEVKFGNGSSFYFELCHGSENFYDNAVFYTRDGVEIVFDCTYSLDETIEFAVKDQTYVIKIILE